MIRRCRIFGAMRKFHKTIIFSMIKLRNIFFTAVLTFTFLLTIDSLPACAEALKSSDTASEIQNAVDQTTAALQSTAGSGTVTTSAAQSAAAADSAATSAGTASDAVATLSADPVILEDGTVFDPVYYALMNADVVRKYGTDPDKMLWHYLNYGISEGRFPSNPITEKDKDGQLLSVTETKDGKNASLNASAAEKLYKTIGTGTPYSVLALGNSITKTAYTELWWGYWGMGASCRERDYIHLLQSMIAADHEVTMTVQNFSIWEQPEPAGTTRTGALSSLDSLMTQQYDLIVIELGENIINTTDLVNDYQNLINYLEIMQPSAQIVIVGDFWENKAVDAAEKSICKTNKLAYVDASDLRNSKFYVGMGTIVSGDDGKEHMVRNSGVAMHPNDTAMAVYAERIYNVLTNL